MRSYVIGLAYLEKHRSDTQIFAQFYFAEVVDLLYAIGTEQQKVSALGCNTFLRLLFSRCRICIEHPVCKRCAFLVKGGCSILLFDIRCKVIQFWIVYEQRHKERNLDESVGMCEVDFRKQIVSVMLYFI